MAEYSVCRGCFHSYVCEQFNEHRNDNNEKCHFFNDHFVPAADVVAVRHGVWEQADNTKRGQKFICSVCKGVSYYTQPTRDKKWVKHCGYPHCPHCLARMDGEGEDNA